MKSILRKLIFGKTENNLSIGVSFLIQQKNILGKIWDNENHNDAGLERFLRLFLIAIQFIFPGLYIRELFRKSGITSSNLAIEVYVLSKLLYPIFIFYLGKSHNPIFQVIGIYLVSETITYVSSLVFTDDIKYETRSINRSILLIFLNYVEISLQFALLYSGYKMLSPNAITDLDFIYFSFITSASLGYGDIFPMSQAGKLLACFHSLLLLIFVVLFFNYFGNKRMRGSK